MLSMRREIVFSIKELRHVAITCPHCGTDVVLDMAYEPQIPPPLRGRTRFAPVECPACKNPYDTALNALEELQRAYRFLSKVDGVVRFRAAAPGEEERE